MSTVHSPLKGQTPIPLAATRITESSLRRVSYAVATVVLVAAGVLVGMHVNPELGATLIAGGIHCAVELIAMSHDQRHSRRSPKTGAFAFALD